MRFISVDFKVTIHLYSAFTSIYQNTNLFFAQLMPYFVLRGYTNTDWSLYGEQEVGYYKESSLLT